MASNPPADTIPQANVIAAPIVDAPATAAIAEDTHEPAAEHATIGEDIVTDADQTTAAWEADQRSDTPQTPAVVVEQPATTSSSGSPTESGVSQPQPQPTATSSANEVLAPETEAERVETEITNPPAEDLASGEEQRQETSTSADVNRVDSRLAIPDDAARAESLALVRELFKDDFANANSLEGKSILASKLLGQARNTEEDPVGRYVLCDQAVKLASSVGDASTALHAVDLLAELFRVDRVGLMASTITEAGKHATTPEAARELVSVVLPVVDEMVEDDHYDEALRMLRAATTAAKRVKDASMNAAVKDRASEIQSLEKQFIALAPVRSTLAKAPRDADANLSLGRFACLVKGDWETGLPMLARGSDETLRALAKLDLTRPEDASEQAKVGDRWWDYATSEKGIPRDRVQQRSAYWYGCNSQISHIQIAQKTRASPLPARS